MYKILPGPRIQNITCANSTGNEVTNIALHITHWKNTPSPVWTFFTGTKLDPKARTATIAAMKPIPTDPDPLIFAI